MIEFKELIIIPALNLTQGKLNQKALKIIQNEKKNRQLYLKLREHEN